ncbi:MAG: hypothetical protein JXR84_27445 [Anaerolineae bacterium]|nr:hypothetical protein [Anaerolineae bacterium]
MRSWFMAGGAFGCLITGAQHWRLYRKALALSQAPQDGTETPGDQLELADEEER